MAYVVNHDFADITDNGYLYRAGDTYPRRGLKPDNARIAELSSNSNRLGEQLISVKREQKPKKEEPVEE